MLVLCQQKEHIPPLYLIITDGIKRLGPQIVKEPGIQQDLNQVAHCTLNTQMKKG